ncbi:PAS domain S-box protein [Marinifilum sp.]|uniref:PAS domain S-box protein n=1 Tax=Marinifilum sp. TaxID=2033137 RepID=UPI003BAC3E18
MSEQKDYTIKRLREELYFYKSIIDNSKNWEYVTNSQGECIYVSNMAELITGYSSEEFYANKKLINQIIHPEDVTKYEEHDHELDDDGFRKSIEYRIISKSGKVEWIDHDCVRVYNDKGRLIGVRSINRVITEKKELESKYKELSNIHQSIVSQSPTGIATYDKDGNCIFANPMIGKIIGATHDQVLLQNYHFIQSWKDCGLYEQILKAYREERSIEYEFEVESSFGKESYLNCVVVPLNGVSKASLMLLVEDVSEKHKTELELKKSQEVTATLLNASDEAAFLIDLDAKFLAVNSICTDRLKSKERDLIGNCAYDFLPKSVIESRKQAMHEVVAKKETVTLIDERDGLIVKSKLYPVLNNKGELIQIAIYSKDITQDLIAERKIKESEEQFRTITSNMKEGITFVNEEGKFLYANSAFCEMSGFSLQELKNLNIFEMKADPNAPNIAYNESLKTGEGKNRGAEFRRKDGSVYNVDVRSQLITIGNQKYITGLISDITEQLKQEKELKQIKDKLTNFIETNPVGMFFLSLKKPMPIGYSTEEKYNWIKSYLYIENCNDATAKAYGYIKKEDLINKKLFELFWNDDQLFRQAVKAFIKHSANGKNIEIVGKSKSGDYINLINNSFHVIQDNQLYSIQGSVENITERKKLEKDLKLAIASKDKFISIISHDLRSPFASILGFSEMIMEKIEKKEYNKLQKYAVLIDKAIQNTYSFLNNLLVWAQSQSDKIIFNPNSYSVGDLIQEPLELAKQIASAKNIEVSLSLEKDMCLFVDREMIETVLRNLFSNAIKFTPENGKVELSIIKAYKTARLNVIDSGVGIDKEHFAKLFKIEESFSKEGTNGEKGFGLGLLLCKEFAKKNKGRILVKSEMGKGSVFTIELPLAD